MRYQIVVAIMVATIAPLMIAILIYYITTSNNAIIFTQTTSTSNSTVMSSPPTPASQNVISPTPVINNIPTINAITTRPASQNPRIRVLQMNSPSSDIAFTDAYLAYQSPNSRDLLFLDLRYENVNMSPNLQISYKYKNDKLYYLSSNKGVKSKWKSSRPGVVFRDMGGGYHIRDGEGNWLRKIPGAAGGVPGFSDDERYPRIPVQILRKTD